MSSKWRPSRMAANAAAHITADFFTAEVLLTYVSTASLDLKDYSNMSQPRDTFIVTLTCNLSWRSATHCCSSAKFDVAKSSVFPPVNEASSEYMLCCCNSLSKMSCLNVKTSEHYTQQSYTGTCFVSRLSATSFS